MAFQTICFSSTKHNARRRLGRFQYRLCHLMLASVLVSVAIVPWAILERRYRDELKATEQIEAWGGKVERTAVWPSWMPERYRRAVDQVVLRDAFAAPSSIRGPDPFAASQARGHSAANVEPFKSDAALDILRAFPALQHLDLGSVAIDGSFLSQIPRRSRIEQLNLSRTAVGNEVEALQTFKRLRSLSLHHTCLDDAGLARISGCSALEELELSYTQITDRGLSSLTSLTELRSLNISGTEVRGTGLREIRNLGKLSFLWMNGPAPILRPHVALLDPSAASVRVTFEPAHTQTRSPRRELSSMPILRSLSMLSLANTYFDESSIIAISKQPHLVTLDLSGTNIKDTWLKHVVRMNLQELSISDTALSGNGLATIASISTLKSLRIERVQCTPDDIAALVTLPSLEHLALDRFRGGSALVTILEQFPRLRSLGVTNSDLTDPDVARLKALSRLELLDVTGNAVKEGTLLRLRPRTKSASSSAVPLEL